MRWAFNIYFQKHFVPKEFAELEFYYIQTVKGICVLLEGPFLDSVKSISFKNRFSIKFRAHEALDRVPFCWRK